MGYRNILPSCSRILAATLCAAVFSLEAKAADLPLRPATPARGVQTVERPAAQPFSEDELSELSRRAEQPDQTVVGGALNNQQLTYIVIALATAVVILVIIAA